MRRVMLARAGTPLVACALVAALVACSQRVARPMNPGAKRCQASLRDAFALILLSQGESDEVADAVAVRAAQELAAADIGPNPFKIASPSGVDYAFFFEDEDRRCLLHLVAWQKGSVHHANNVTYIATRPLHGCRCEK